MKLKKVLAIAVAVLSACPMMMAQGEGMQMPPIPVDPAVKTGKLANGLTYYVRQNNYPEHQVNFYIAQRVGSIQEEESQRGLAHFLEHMAFNGTVNYPGNGVIDYTRTLGVEFGGDLNAYTSIDQTVYNISNVPSTRQSALDSCLLILKDWSNGLLLEGDEIDKERGVIHEEWRLRSSASQRMLERNLETLYPGSKYGKRMPIGLMDVIDNFKYDEIRNYYHKWYRPDNQAIIVVGDIDVDYMEAKIKEMFSTIPAAAPDAAQVVAEPVPDNNEAIVVVDKDKEQQINLVQVMWKHDPFPEELKGSMAYPVYDYVVSQASDMINARLAEKAQEPDCPYIQAAAGNGSYILSKTKDAFYIYVVPKDGKTAEAVQAATEEVLRAQKHGFTATEYARTKAEYLSQLEKEYEKRNQTNNDRFGRLYASNYLENEPLMSIETEYQIMNQIVPMLPVEAVNQSLQEFVSPSDTNLVVLSFNQEKDGAVYPTVADLKGAIDAAQAAELAPYVDNVKDEPLIKQLPKAGKITKEVESKKFGYKTLTLSNGATVVLKKTDYKDNEVLMQAESRGGNSLYGQKDQANFELFDAVVSQSGLGEFDNTELDKALAGKQASVNLNLSTSYERASGNSTKKDLETLFQLTYLKFTAIKKDEKAYGNLMSMLEIMLRNQGLTPEAAFSDSVSYTYGNHTWRERPFKVEELQKVNYDRVLEMAKERYGNAADFTFYFVGDFDEETIKPLIEQYIASLPANPKAKKENWVNVEEHPKGHVVNKFTRKMETPKANARMYWYNTAVPYTMDNNLKASVAGQVLSKIYLQKIREEESAAYSAGAAGYQQLTGDRPNVAIIGYCPMKPEKSDVALSLMRQGIQDVAKSVDETTLQEIKELTAKEFNKNQRENSYWLNMLTMYVERGIDMNTGYLETLNGITTSSVSKFVKDVILAGDSVEVIMLPEE